MTSRVLLGAAPGCLLACTRSYGPQFGFATVLPDGVYAATTFTVE